MRVIVTALLGLVLAGQGGPSVSIRPGSVGPVSIGMSVEDINRTFPAGRRRPVNIPSEDGPQPTTGLTLEGSTFRDGVLVEFAGPTGHQGIERMWVKDPIARTEKGIGVGSTVAELRAAYRIAWVSNGEGTVWMRVEELGASFELDQGGPEGHALALIRDPAAVPGSVKIVSVLLTKAG
jgi:hypothetical protein